MYNINDYVYIRPDLIDFEEVNERGRIDMVKDGLYHVTNVNMPFIGTISAWFTENEISATKYDWYLEKLMAL